MKKKIKYIIFNFAKYSHYIVHPRLLMYSLLFLKKIPLINKIVNFFDPNDIRKVTNYNIRASLLKIPNKKYNLLVNTRDHIGFNSFINKEPFEMSVYNLVEKIKPSNKKIIIDIGANIGSASVPICAKYNLELIAIEPSKDNTNLLKQNILNNQIKAQIYQYALVDNSFDDENIKLYINEGNTGANSLIEKWNPSKNRKLIQKYEIVPVKTFDKILDEINLNIDTILCVKIDVEGMEYSVISGSNKFLENNSAPIIMEYRNDVLKKYSGQNMIGVVNLLRKSNYNLYSISSSARLGIFDEKKSYENIIALKEGDFLKLLTKELK